MLSMQEAVGQTSYPGRGIILGKSADGKQAVMAYFIMGRSENSRNRVFVEDGAGIRTEACDPAKMRDPSLIIYSPVRVLAKGTPVMNGLAPAFLQKTVTIVTNGDQTDTVYEHLTRGGSFEEALRTRAFEPDAPNYTPRISGVMREDGAYQLAILKSADGDPAECLRFFYEYEAPVAGVGHFLHTYRADGDPLPSFAGEPTAVAIGNELDNITEQIWTGLNSDNKVSLFVRAVDIATGEKRTRILNKYQKTGGQ